MSVPPLLAHRVPARTRGSETHDRPLNVPGNPSPRRADRPRVTLVISSLGPGGAERVLSTMANHWAGRGWPMTLITIEPTTGDFYALRPVVERVGLGVSGVSRTIWRAMWNNWRRVSRLRHAIRASRPDVIISFMTETNVLALLAAHSERVPVIISERVDPTLCPVRPVWARLRRLTYPWAAAVVVQTPEVRRWAERFLPRDAVHVIPNPVAAPPDDICAEHRGSDTLLASAADTTRHVVAVGRLDSQKGFDLLIKAFAECHRSRPEWRLTIVGEGDDRNKLEALARQLGVASAVRLQGHIAEPISVLRKADLFVLSSRYEGFPNVLLEAMAAGLPVIATDCPSGPAHIVRNDVDGVRVRTEDAGALARAMAALMDDEARRKRLGESATSVTGRFGIERVMESWESLLSRVIAPYRQGRDDS